MKKAIVYLLIPLLTLAFLSLYRLDFYIMQPGSAHDVSGFIEVQSGDDNDQGTLSLMTVTMYQATPLTYAFATVQDNKKILPLEQVLNPHEDKEEYNVRQLKLMEDSQFNAKLVAFQQAKLPYNIQYKGIYVLNVLEGGASEKILKTGDNIIAVNGEIVKRQQDLVDRLENKQLGDHIELVIVRGNKKMNVSTNLKAIPGASVERAGLGISFAENKSIRTNPKVEVSTDDIGGPSAGLMFTLGMLNQLLDEDITKGYKIAGTGEMLEDGTVGRIGGIDMKVIAAAEEGMDIFFAPNDEITTEMRNINPTIETNYETAVKTAKQLGTNMKIVPVKTIDDALMYLEKLRVK